jgi:hypothetical protein
MTVVTKKQADGVEVVTVGRSGTSSPYFDLGASIAVAEVIHRSGGGTASPDQLAPWLGYKSTTSGTYLTRLSAANKHFKLVNINGDRITLTERALTIIAPVMPNDAINAKVEAFLSVPLFAKVFEQYRGNTLPPEGGLKNLFQTQYRILPDRVAQAVRVFLNSADQAGFFSTTGDRSRLVRPSIQASATNSVVSSEQQRSEFEEPLQEKSKNSISGNDGTGGVHSAIVGLLRELPAPGTPWADAKKQRFLDAFKATIDFIYPPEETT